MSDKSGCSSPMDVDELLAIKTALQGYWTCSACRLRDPETVQHGAVPVHVDCPTPDAKGNALCFEAYEFPTRDQTLAIVRGLLRYRGVSDEVFDPELVRIGERLLG